MRRVNWILTAGLLVSMMNLASFRGVTQSSAEIHGNLGLPKKADNPFLPEEKEELRQILAAALGSMEHDSDLDKVKKILKHQADIAVYGYHEFDVAKERHRAAVIYADMRTRKIGHMCPGHADVLIGMLEIYGVPARRILAESFDSSNPGFVEYKKKEIYGSHSAVEVKIDGRWILADPTFFMLAKHEGKYLSVREGVELLCANPSTQFEFEAVSDRCPVSACYNGVTKEYFRDMMFARVIVYKPFHKYPYDDVYCCPIQMEGGTRKVYLSMHNGITVKTLTPTDVPSAALHRDRMAFRSSPDEVEKHAAIKQVE